VAAQWGRHGRDTLRAFGASGRIGLTLPAAWQPPTDAWYTTGLRPYRRDGSGAAGRDLGWEIDTRATWAASAHLEVLAGFGRFFPGAFVRRTGAASTANWFCAQGTYSW
jgi:hypothetical protein